MVHPQSQSCSAVPAIVSLLLEVNCELSGVLLHFVPISILQLLSVNHVLFFKLMKKSRLMSFTNKDVFLCVLHILLKCLVLGISSI